MTPSRADPALRIKRSRTFRIYRAFIASASLQGLLVPSRAPALERVGTFQVPGHQAPAVHQALALAVLQAPRSG